MKFPLFNIEENRLTSLRGEVSSFYSLDMPDIDQMDNDELMSYSINLKQSLCSLKENDFFKIYYVDSKSFINTTSNVESLNNIKFIENKNPLSIIFENNLNSSIDFYEDYYLIDGVFKKIISVRTFPSELDICGLSGISDFFLSFKRISNLEAKNKLNLKRRLHFSQLFQDIKNIESSNAYSEAENLLEGIANNEDALFKVEMYFIISGKSKVDVDIRTREVIDLLKEIDCEPRVESRTLASCFNSLIPGVDPIFLRSHLMPASYLINLLPLENDQLQDKGITFRSRRQNNIDLNIFDSTAHNYNCLITGSSGQGKSVLANKILLEEVKTGSCGVVLDLGNSFRKNITYLNGSIISNSFNPLLFNNAEYLKEFILSFIDESWGQKDQGRLLKQIKEHISEVSSFKELISILDKSFEGISYYFEEVWSFLTNDSDVVEDLVYCDLTIYPERLKRPVIIYLIEYFKNQNGKRIFIFDECWNLLESNANYIAECFRTFRKFNASAIAISQNIDDFSETVLGKVIIQNTFYKLLFRQNISNTVFLSNYEKDLVLDLRSSKRKYSEFLVLSEEIRKITRYYPTPIEYELFTSDRTDTGKFEDYYQEVGKFLGFKRAIDNYTKEKYIGGEM